MTRKAKAAPAAAARRPTVDDLPAVLDGIWDGKSLRSICEVMGLDAPSTSRLLNDPANKADYDAATAGRGDHYAEKVMDTADDVFKGTIKPDVGRVVMDGYKWAAARMNRKRWGDKMALTGGDDGDAPIQFQRIERKIVRPSNRDG